MAPSLTDRKRERKNWFYSYDMIFEQNISEHAKLIYLYLCRCSDSTGKSFPSRSTIATKCSIGVKTVDRALKELQEIGLLQKEIRKDHDGFHRSNLYFVSDSPCVTEGEDSVTETPRVASQGRGGSVTETPWVASQGRRGSVTETPRSTTHINVPRIEGEGGEAPQTAPAQNTYGEFKHVRLTPEQHDSLVASAGEEKTADYINRVDRHIETKGLKSRNHYATIKDWIAKDSSKQPYYNQQGAPTVRKNKFVNFKQRDRDFKKFEEMEREYQSQRLGM